MIPTSSTLMKPARFPRLQECAHFHYEVSTVDIPKNFKVVMCVDHPDNGGAGGGSTMTINGDSDRKMTNGGGGGGLSMSSNALTSSTISTATTANGGGGGEGTFVFQIQVTANEKRWIISRTYENFRYLDKHLHDCIFDRKFSCLEEPQPLALLMCSGSGLDAMTSSISSVISTCSSALNGGGNKNSKYGSNHGNNNNNSSSTLHKQLTSALAQYLARFCEIAFINPINCGPILNWFEIDNKGNRLYATDDSPINIPGVAAAVVKKRYVAQGLDELSLDVGNMISVIDMPPSDESMWWRGKKELEVGFFPADCIEIIKCNQNTLSNVSEHLPKFGQNQSVRLKHGKLITLLRSFFHTRPARNQLQSKGILKQRVFACDLGEHLSNTQQEVPKILVICTKFIETYGIVDGIYRHTGLQSNIQRLRNAFDEEKFNEIEQEIYINDVHAVSSLLKMYFRELPNPLLTYQLYQKFISIAESLMKAMNVEDKIIEIHDVVQQLPPPHYRTLAFLMRHLHKLAEFSPDTNMNTKNLAIVWAPNLLKSKEMDSTDCMQYDMLHSITLQANISEFMIANADTIFNDKFASLVRKHDLKNNIAKTYRPISVCYNAGGAKLLSLEEAQDKYKQVGPSEMPKFHTVIEIPDLKKKKSKDKKNGQNCPNNAVNSNVNIAGGPQVPANIQIQQQFDALQQQQQQMTASSSSYSVSSSPMTQGTSSNGTAPVPNGSSSPALKSLFRSLRGSMKQPSSSPNMLATAGVVAETTTSPYARQLYSSQVQNLLSNSAAPGSFESSDKPASLARQTSTNTTFKPSSVNNEQMIRDYGNCLTQLQSAASQAVQHSNLMTSSAVGLSGGSPSVQSQIPPVFQRANKLNQSQNSIHSSHLSSAPQPLIASIAVKLSPTSETGPSSLCSTPSSLSTFQSSEKKDANNPVPSKRRTIVQNGCSPAMVSTNNGKSFAPLPPQQQPAPHSSEATPLLASSANLNVGGQLSDKFDNIQLKDESEQHQQLVNVKGLNSKQMTSSFQPNGGNSSNRKPSEGGGSSSTGGGGGGGDNDEMQRWVLYMNQFEKENISSVASLAAATYNKSKLKQQQQNQIYETSLTSPTAPPLIQQRQQTIEIPSKLRLSSSSLSSSVESCSNENNFVSSYGADGLPIDEDDPESYNDKLNPSCTSPQQSATTTTTTTIKLASNENDAVMVTTSNLNSILTINGSTDNGLAAAKYDEQIYENTAHYTKLFEAEMNAVSAGSSAIGRANTTSIVLPAGSPLSPSSASSSSSSPSPTSSNNHLLNDDDGNQYEKVILKHVNTPGASEAQEQAAAKSAEQPAAPGLKKSSPKTSDFCDYDDTYAYDNGLLVADTSSKKPTLVVNRAHQEEMLGSHGASGQDPQASSLPENAQSGNESAENDEVHDEHIYININQFKEMGRQAPRAPVMSHHLGSCSTNDVLIRGSLGFDVQQLINSRGQSNSLAYSESGHPFTGSRQPCSRVEESNEGYYELSALSTPAVPQGAASAVAKPSDKKDDEAKTAESSRDQMDVSNDEKPTATKSSTLTADEVQESKQPPPPIVSLRSKSTCSASFSCASSTSSKSSFVEHSTINDENDVTQSSDSSTIRPATDNLGASPPQGTLTIQVQSKNHAEADQNMSEMASDASSFDTNAKRKSSLSMDEFKRRRSDNSADTSEMTDCPKSLDQPLEQETSQEIKLKQAPKHRQSLSQPSKPMTVAESSTTGPSDRSRSPPSLKKSPSRSLEKSDSIEDQTSSECEKLSVKTKIKLMESIVRPSCSQSPVMVTIKSSKNKKQTSSSGNERSASASSASSTTSSSRSPPISPGPDTSMTTSTTNKQSTPPVVLARSTIAPSQVPAVAPRPLKNPLINPSPSTGQSSSVEPVNQGSRSPPKPRLTIEQNTGTEIPTSNRLSSTSNQKLSPSQTPPSGPILNPKEKRRTVKELLSQFEPK